MVFDGIFLMLTTVAGFFGGLFPVTLIIDTKDGIVEIDPSDVFAVRRFTVECVARSAYAHHRFAFRQMRPD